VLSAFIQLDIYRTWSLLNSHTVFRKRLMDFVSSPSRNSQDHPNYPSWCGSSIFWLLIGALLFFDRHFTLHSTAFTFYHSDIYTVVAFAFLTCAWNQNSAKAFRTTGMYSKSQHPFCTPSTERMVSLSPSITPPPGTTNDHKRAWR
jgi:hypothetical protein